LAVKYAKSARAAKKNDLTKTARSGIIKAGNGNGAVSVSKSEKLPAIEYALLNEEQTKKLQAQSDDVYRNKLTKGGRDTEKDAVDEYTDGMHLKINPLLYGKNTDAPQIQEKYWQYIRNIDSAMDKFYLDCDLVAYSGTKAKHYADWSVGDEKTINAYLSTSTQERFAKAFSKPTKNNPFEPLMIEVRVPAGTKSLYIGDNTKYKKMEDELLLGRGLRYKVIEKKSGRMIIEVIP